ncbi:MAG: DUF885 domain-containing protein [Actinobacteria bacterium]|nr:DUF885 domain-containing protein [Actinomycetota bacterium]
MSTPFEISDRFTDQWADLSPVDATSSGVAGRDHLSTDYSPDGEAQRAALYRSTRRQLSKHVDHPDPAQAMASRVIVGWLDTRISDHDDQKWARDINHIYGPFQNMRDSFDVMPKASQEEWDSICARLNGFGGMLAGYRASLTVGVDAGETVALRQAKSLLSQVEASASEQSRFLAFPREAESVGADSVGVTEAVEAARSGCADFAEWLRTSYLPVASPHDAVGEERYLRGADHFLGIALDPRETYEWGWSEVHRLRAEMASTAADIDPDLTIEEVVDLLDTDPERSATTRREFVDFVFDIQQQAIEQLAGEHFEVPDEMRFVSVNIAPPGGSLGAWYIGPSEDFSRSGSIWYALGERERIPYWQEVSTAYHEGFPGHHLQVATAVREREKLSRFQRSVVWYSGSGEGWALYAERLMDELGFFEKPEYRLGLLSSQLFRATRVVVDIGAQLELRIPDDAPLHRGEVWDYEKAVDYMEKVGLQPRDIAESEVKRYLGWIGQAISYKVGEREILKIRDESMTRHGSGFDRRKFHRQMLEAGAIRLDLLKEVML